MRVRFDKGGGNSGGASLSAGELDELDYEAAAAAYAQLPSAAAPRLGRGLVGCGYSPATATTAPISSAGVGPNGGLRGAALAGVGRIGGHTSGLLPRISLSPASSFTSGSTSFLPFPQASSAISVAPPRGDDDDGGGGVGCGGGGAGEGDRTYSPSYASVPPLRDGGTSGGHYRSRKHGHSGGVDRGGGLISLSVAAAVAPNTAAPTSDFTCSLSPAFPSQRIDQVPFPAAAMVPLPRS